MRGDRAALEDGSALLLFPAAVLVVVVLASMAVDRAVVVGAQRSLVATAQAAANDAAAAGVDVDALRSGGRIAYDPVAIDRAVHAAVTSEPAGTAVRWWRQGGLLHVRLEREVDLIFSPAVPGAAHRLHVTATASARLDPL